VSGAVSGQCPPNHPGNCRDVSEQLAENISPSTDECPRQSLHQSWRDGLQMTW